MPITPYFTFAFVLLATLLASTITHAQQGNLPTPVQKLPAYPPVVCVTPNWTTEPCADRTLSEGAKGWKALYELAKFFASWPAWTRGMDFPTRPPKFVWPQQEECPKDPHPFWPCPVQPHSEDELAGAAVRAVYLKQSLEAKNLVYYWMIGTAVRSEPDYLLEQLARESKPLTDRLARESTPQAVKCLNPDGTEEPCESRHTRPKTVLYHEPGGILADHLRRWQALALTGDEIEIRGPCASGCTMIMAYILNDRLCFSEQASLKFHLARDKQTGEASISTSQWMLSHYPQDIRLWLRARGGVEKMSIEQYWTLGAAELWAMGYRRCEEAPPMPMMPYQGFTPYLELPECDKIKLLTITQICRVTP
jgi:hypothetical protein